MSHENELGTEDKAIEEQKPLLGYDKEIENLSPNERSQSSLYSLKSSKKMESPTSLGTLTFLKSLIGTGILALPQVINAVGVVPGWVLLISVGYLNLYTMQLIHLVATDLRLAKVDLGRLVERVTRRMWFRQFAEWNLNIMQIGSIAASVVFISQYLEKISCYLEWSFLCEHTLIQFGLIIVFVLPATSVTDLHFLAIPNIIGLALQLILCVAFLFASIQTISQNGVTHGGLKASLQRFEISGIPVAFATMVYAYEGIGLLLDIRTSVAETKKLDNVLYLSFAASTIVYTLFGSAGALAYGDSTQSIIFLNMNNQNKLLLVAEFGYLLALIVGIPNNLFPVVKIIENYMVFRKWITDEKTGKKSKLKRQIIRLPVILLVCAIAAVIPSFNSFLSFLGGLNYVILSSIIPIVLYYIQFRADPEKRLQFFINWIIMVISIILGSISVVQSVIDMVNGTD